VGLEATAVSAEADSLLWELRPGRRRRPADAAISTAAPGGREHRPRSWSVPAGNPWDYDFFLRVLGTDGSLDIRDSGGTRSTLVSIVQRPTARGGLRQVSFGEDGDTWR